MQEQLSVFISSTSDLSEARNAVESALRSLGIAASRYETWASSPNPPVPECLAKVALADAVALIMGQKYRCGEGTGLSVTHEEYRHARELGKDVFLFVLQADDREPDQKDFLKEARSPEGVFHCAEIVDVSTLESEVKRAFQQDYARLRRNKLEKATKALRVEVAETHRGLPVSCRFYRRGRRSSPGGRGPAQPAGTVFEFFLKVTNAGQAFTSIRDFVLRVEVARGEPWTVRDRYSKPDVLCRDYSQFGTVALSSTLQPDQDLEAPPGRFTPPIAIAMWTGEEVPGEIAELQGTLICTDLFGNSASARLTFTRFR